MTPMNRLAGVDGLSVDAVVIGGGIAGAGVARDLAMRGVTVALFDKGDFGSGTSSKSSKLVHGGLRYLELMDFGLVRESLREKRTLERLAPHLVRPLPFLVPVYRGGTRRLVSVGRVIGRQVPPASSPRDSPSRHAFGNHGTDWRRPGPRMIVRPIRRRAVADPC